MKKIAFISDFFSSELIGGTEKNDDVLINFLKQKFEITKIKSSEVKIDHLDQYDMFVLSNFTLLDERVKPRLSMKRFIIYEHDHKYVSTRDPSCFKDFQIPKEKIVNKFLYKRAYKVFVLSQICKDILENNLNLNNVVNIGTSLWTDKDLQEIEEISLTKVCPQDRCSILKSDNPTKGYAVSLNFCKRNNLEYNTIETKNQIEIWRSIKSCKSFLFAPQVLETFSRITCEAKMLGVDVITNPKMVGFFS